MRFFWDNFIDLATTTITSETQALTLPDDNVAHQHKKKVYRTGLGLVTGVESATEWIKFDLGSAKAIDGFALLNHTLDGTETAVNIEGHASDDFGTPTFSEAVTVTSDPAFNKFSSAQSFRWWRFEFTKASAGTARDLGRIFLGDVYDATEDPDAKGYADEVVEKSITKKSIDGQSYTYIKDEYDKIKTTFKSISLAQAIKFKTIFDSLGNHTPLLIQVNPSVSDGVREVMHYVKFVKGLKRKVSSYTDELKWDVALEFEEQL